MAEKAIILLRLKDIPVNKKSVWYVNNGLLYHIDNKKTTSYSCYDHIIYKKTNKSIFDEHLKEVMGQLFEGINLTIFAYGQTGSGKTHSMLGNENEKGIIYFSLNHILRKIEEAEVSFIEIYNEKLFDLIEKNSKVNLYNVDNEPVLTGNASVKIKSTDKIDEILKMCEQNRRISSTEYNTRSSRSHTIFKITLKIKEKNVHLNLIDLAGSEKASNDLERRREGAFINKSLLALGSVINNLSKKEHTGFRDSKLTRLLQPSMEGDSILIALCLISPEENCVDESISTLNFAARLGKIQFEKRITETNILLEKCVNIKYLCQECGKNLHKHSDTPSSLAMDYQSENKSEDKESDLSTNKEIKENQLEIKQSNMEIKKKVPNANEENKKMFDKNEASNKIPEKNSEESNKNIVVDKKTIEINFSSEEEKKPSLISSKPPTIFEIMSRKNEPILNLNYSKEEPIDIFNMYLTDDRRVPHYEEIAAIRKKENMDLKMEYLEKKMNLYQERVEELEKWFMIC